MNCHQCGEVLDTGFSFCEACGAAVLPGNAAVTAVTTVQAGAALASGDKLILACKCGRSEFDVDGVCENCGRRAEVLDPIDVLNIAAHSASATHRGRQHTENQDAVGMAEIGSALAFAVADGVSTACRSREASATAVRVALTALQQNTGLPAAQRLQAAVQEAHLAVCNLPYDDRSLAEPETTLVLAIVEADIVHFSWVGDSRLYALNGATLKLLSEDDSWLNQQLKSGVSLAAAMNDGNAHCITQCLGMRDDELDIHVASFPLDDDTSLLLCTDGLWNYCQDEQVLQNFLTMNLPVTEHCRQLIDFANQQGGHDNISLIVHRHIRSRQTA